MTYYNEWDPYAAQWLRNLMAAGHISKGVVDERSIKDVQSGDVPSRAHFFAGIAGWEYALQLAGWPADRPVWTGSCPCQPFSAAGKRGGNLDARHLWPDFYALVRERMPSTIFGEQVASADGRIWLDGVRADMEALGYAFGAADLCAAGVSAPHIRQRLYWVAHSPGERFDGRQNPTWKNRGASFEDCSHVASADGWMEHAESNGRQQWRPESSRWGAVGRCGTDGKWRRIEPGLEPLAHGVPGRVGKLRAYGNAIVPQLAAEFIAAFMETLA